MTHLYRVWELTEKDEQPLTEPTPFAAARVNMRLILLSKLRQLGWSLFNQGNQFANVKTPTGMYGLLIRQEYGEADLQAQVNVQSREWLTRTHSEEGFDYTITADMPTPTDGLFDREGTYPQAKWEVAENG
ncbi:MAG: hypothetical protein LCI00_17070 [Chloroflexi bacterium]|nr:hypothetical protein [Chloroflexota bacterium]